MEGGSGNDTYVVDYIGDMVTEANVQGVDTVQASATFALSANVENLTLTGGAAIDATGNGKANSLIGNAAANRLDGRGGADKMKGGLGDDTYVVDNVGDAVAEKAGEGHDTRPILGLARALARMSRICCSSAQANVSATGNALANAVTGNAGDNAIAGGLGKDVLTGGAGADNFVFDFKAGKKNADTILDFKAGVDHLVLDGDVFKKLQRRRRAQGEVLRLRQGRR